MSSQGNGTNNNLLAPPQTPRRRSSERPRSMPNFHDDYFQELPQDRSPTPTPAPRRAAVVPAPIAEEEHASDDSDATVRAAVMEEIARPHAAHLPLAQAVDIVEDSRRRAGSAAADPALHFFQNPSYPPHHRTVYDVQYAPRPNLPLPVQPPPPGYGGGGGYGGGYGRGRWRAQQYLYDHQRARVAFEEEERQEARMDEFVGLREETVARRAEHAAELRELYAQHAPRLGGGLLPPPQMQAQVLDLPQDGARGGAGEIGVDMDPGVLPPSPPMDVFGGFGRGWAPQPLNLGPGPGLGNGAAGAEEEALRALQERVRATDELRAREVRERDAAARRRHDPLPRVRGPESEWLEQDMRRNMFFFHLDPGGPARAAAAAVAPDLFSKADRDPEAGPRDKRELRAVRRNWHRFMDPVDLARRDAFESPTGFGVLRQWPADPDPPDPARPPHPYEVCLLPLPEVLDKAYADRTLHAPHAMAARVPWAYSVRQPRDLALEHRLTRLSRAYPSVLGRNIFETYTELLVHVKALRPTRMAYLPRHLERNMAPYLAMQDQEDERRDAPGAWEEVSPEVREWMEVPTAGEGEGGGPNALSEAARRAQAELRRELQRPDSEYVFVRVPAAAGNSDSAQERSAAEDGDDYYGEQWLAASGQTQGWREPPTSLYFPYGRTRNGPPRPVLHPRILPLGPNPLFLPLPTLMFRAPRVVPDAAGSTGVAPPSLIRRAPPETPGARHGRLLREILIGNTQEGKRNADLIPSAPPPRRRPRKWYRKMCSKRQAPVENEGSGGDEADDARCRSPSASAPLGLSAADIALLNWDYDDFPVPLFASQLEFTGRAFAKEAPLSTEEMADPGAPADTDAGRNLGAARALEAATLARLARPLEPNTQAAVPETRYDVNQIERERHAWQGTLAESFSQLLVRDEESDEDEEQEGTEEEGDADDEEEEGLPEDDGQEDDALWDALWETPRVPEIAATGEEPLDEIDRMWMELIGNLRAPSAGNPNDTMLDMYPPISDFDVEVSAQHPLLHNVEGPPLPAPNFGFAAPQQPPPMPNANNTAPPPPMYYYVTPQFLPQNTDNMVPPPIYYYVVPPPPQPMYNPAAPPLPLPTHNPELPRPINNFNSVASPLLPMHSSADVAPPFPPSVPYDFMEWELVDMSAPHGVGSAPATDPYAWPRLDTAAVPSVFNQAPRAPSANRLELNAQQGIEPRVVVPANDPQPTTTAELLRNNVPPNARQARVRAQERAPVANQPPRAGVRPNNAAVNEAQRQRDTRNEAQRQRKERIMAEHNDAVRDLVSGFNPRWALRPTTPPKTTQDSIDEVWPTSPKGRSWDPEDPRRKKSPDPEDHYEACFDRMTPLATPTQTPLASPTPSPVVSDESDSSSNTSNRIGSINRGGGETAAAAGPHLILTDASLHRTATGAAAAHAAQLVQDALTGRPEYLSSAAAAACHAIIGPRLRDRTGLGLADVVQIAGVVQASRSQTRVCEWLESLEDPCEEEPEAGTAERKKRRRRVKRKSGANEGCGAGNDYWSDSSDDGSNNGSGNFGTGGHNVTGNSHGSSRSNSEQQQWSNGNYEPSTGHNQRQRAYTQEGAQETVDRTVHWGQGVEMKLGDLYPVHDGSCTENRCTSQDTYPFTKKIAVEPQKMQQEQSPQVSPVVLDLSAWKREFFTKREAPKDLEIGAPRFASLSFEKKMREGRRISISELLELQQHCARVGVSSGFSKFEVSTNETNIQAVSSKQTPASLSCENYKIPKLDSPTIEADVVHPWRLTYEQDFWMPNNLSTEAAAAQESGKTDTSHIQFEGVFHRDSFLQPQQAESETPTQADVRAAALRKIGFRRKKLSES